MNIFDAIYCSQYYEMKRSGKDPMKGRLAGTAMSALILLLGIVPFVVVISRLFPGNFFTRFIEGTAGSVPARVIGKISGLGAMAVAGGIFYYTIGSEANYRRKMLEWEQLPEEDLKRTLRVTLITFGILLVIFLAVVFGQLI